MVAITVILAAVIAAFVLDLGGSVGQEAQAGVTIEVDEQADQIQVEITSIGNADHVNLSGTVVEDDDSWYSSGDASAEKDTMSELGVGDVIVIGGTSDATVQMTSSAEDSGTITAIAVIEEDGTKTQVASEDFDLDWS